MRMFIGTLVVGVLVGVSHSLAQNNCPINGYVFQDQDGNEATVKNIRECFGWFNKDHSIKSSSKASCYTHSDAKRIIAREKKGDVRLVGSRIFTILYKQKFINIEETKVVGVPWLSYEVDPGLTGTRLSLYKAANPIFELMGGGDITFDFTDSAPEGFDTPTKLYKHLLGKQFIFKRCS